MLAVGCVLIVVLAGLAPVVDAAAEHLGDAREEVSRNPPETRTALAPGGEVWNLNFSSDPPGGTPPPPGSVVAAHEAQPPVVSATPGTVIPPVFEDRPTEYRYRTVAGTYVIPKSIPFVLRYETAEGTRLVRGSTFVALASGARLFLNATVLEASTYEYRTRYTIQVPPLQLANVTISYDFFDDRPPKITAEIERPSGLTLPLTWVLYTEDTWAHNDTETVEFSSKPRPERIDAPRKGLSIGPNSLPKSWTRRLGVNWSDADAGNASVGRFDLPGLGGAAVLVEFPGNMTVVDPILVGTSTSSSATYYSVQRKAFQHGDRFFAFWYDGSNIVYASSEFAYVSGANPPNQLFWSGKMSTGSGAIAARGFDVAYRDGRVLVGYIASDFLSFKALVGRVAGAIIEWEAVTTVMTFPNAAASAPSVAIGTDGYLWAAVAWGYARNARIDVSRGEMGIGGSWSWLLSAFDWLYNDGGNLNAPEHAAIRLVALPSGGMFYAWSQKTPGPSELGKYLFARRYALGGWQTTSAGYDADLPRLESRESLFTAVADSDGYVDVLYRGNPGTSPGIRHKTFPPDGGPPISKPALDTSPYSLEPVASRDANEDLHVFWMWSDAPPCMYWIYYRSQRPGDGSWAPASTPFTCYNEMRTGLSAGLVASAYAYVLWTQGDFSPHSIQFGSVPTPLDLGSQTGQPWSRQGISPFQTYFRHLSEFVSPGSGLLTVRQTDLVLPGRKLDLEISRVYLTPRAFQYTGSASAYLYEEYPAANVGRGWRLNFPWMSSQYLHLWDGQMYVLKWEGNSFENHDGEHFILTRTWNAGCSCYSYELVTKSAIKYNFDSALRLTSIEHPELPYGPTISFGYSGNVIDYLTDTLGRTIDFAYNGDGTLQSIQAGPQIVSYGYQTVGNARLLTSVKDSLGRETTFEYTYPGNTYLLTALRYPTGGKSVYSWTNPAVQIGSDLTSYYVTQQDTRNSQEQSVRSNSFEYAIVNGRVTYVKVTTYDQGALKGSTIQHFDPAAGRSTTIRRDAAGVQLGKEVTWYAGGAVGQVDVYPGASSTPSHSTYTVFDEWGNLVHSRDAIGHEQFYSYLSTRSHGGFAAPGRLTRTTSGLRFADDFEDRDLSDWTLTTDAGSVTLDSSTFDSAPPVLKVAHNGAPSGISAATHTFAPQSSSFLTEVVVRAGETNRQHYVLVKASSGSIRVYASLSDSGYVAWWNGASWQNLVPYQANQWYRLSYRVYPSSNTYDIWVNGKLAKVAATMTGSGTIDRISFQASWSGGGAAAMYVDTVKVHGDSLTLNGLAGGKVVRLEDFVGREVLSVRVPSGSTSVTIPIAPGILPHVTVKVLDIDRQVEYGSPGREFWGGDVWTYEGPWRTMSLTRTRNGFLRALGSAYVDDALPIGASGAGLEDGWLWDSDVSDLYLDWVVIESASGSTYPSTELISWGSRVSGTFPVDLQTADFAFVRYRELSDRPDVRHDFANVPSAASYTLKVKGYITDENVEVQVLTPPATWNTRMTINAASNTLYTYTLTSAEYNSGAPRIRFRDYYGVFGGTLADDFSVSGTSTHRSRYLTETHSHQFYDATTTLPLASGEFLIQYVYLPINQVPGEVMLEFRDLGNSWEHRAYWGANLIEGKGTDGTASRLPMGGLPPVGRWAMLIARANNVSLAGSYVEGVGYTLYGGQATWDFTAKGDAETAEIRVTGLQPSWVAKLHDARGNVFASATASANGEAAINAYYGSPRVTSFPFEGSLSVWSAGANLYRSPVLSLWGGDVYAYSPTNFYGSAFGTEAHDRPAGSLEYQTGRAGSPQVPQEAYYSWSFEGRPEKAKVWDGSAWRETSITYDSSSGNPWRVTDPLSNLVQYEWSSVYGYGYPTTVMDDLGNKARTTYDPSTGWVLSGKNPRGYRTTFGYDILGRQLTQHRFDLPTSSDVLYYDMEWTTEEMVPKMEDLSGNARHGTIVGTTSVNGRFGLGRNFASASSQYINTNQDTPFDFGTSDFSISFWARAPSGASGMTAVSKGYHFENYVGYHISTAASPADMLFEVADGTGRANARFYSGVSWSGWKHFVAVKTATELRTYLDGVAQTPTSHSMGNLNNALTLQIGRSPGSGANYFNGDIDEMRVFNRALSASQVASLYSGTFGLLASTETAYDDAGNSVTAYEPTTTPRLLHLDMESLLNGRLEDLAGRGSHGTMTGTTPATGWVGGAREFNGAGDKVEVADSPTVSLTSSFTIAAWVKYDTISAARTIANKINLGTSSGFQLYIKGTDAGVDARKLALELGSGTSITTVLSTGTLPLAGQFYHVAVVYDDPSNTVTFYINGGSSGTPTYASALADNADALRIGVNSVSGSWFDGVLDEGQMFARPLPAADVQAIYQGTEKGFYEKQYFDSLGRVTRVLRRDLFNTFLSMETYTLDFQDQVLTATVRRSSTASYVTSYGYDFLGRPTSATYPDTANPLTIGYDDVNRIRTVTAENGRKMQYVSDLAGGVTAVREYYDPSNYYTTSYAYDDAGNLKTVTNALNRVTAHDYDPLNRLTKTTYPDVTKYEEYTYDAVGNLKTRRDRAGQMTTYDYDDLYRLLRVWAPGGALDRTFVYDANGNPTQVGNSVASVTYTYDAFDRALTESTYFVGGQTYTASYGYDKAGRMTRLTYPDSYAVDYMYDAVGRTRETKSGSTTFATFNYFDDDLVKDVILGNGIVQGYNYNGRGWPTSITATYGMTTYLNLGYTYDGSGNILTMGSTTFTYDKLDRLSTASGGFGYRGYTYDAVGNRLVEDRGSVSYTLLPNANGDIVQWSQWPQTGFNFDKVDDPVPDGDTTHVFTSGVAQMDLYQLSNLPSALNGRPIESVTVTVQARFVETTDPCPGCTAPGGEILSHDSGSIRLALRSYGITSLTSAFPLGEYYSSISWVWATNPATGGSPWTEAEVNALQAGVQLETTTSKVRVTSVTVTVQVRDTTSYTYDTNGMNQLTSTLRIGAVTSFAYDAKGNRETKSGGWSYEYNHDNVMTRALLGGAQQEKYHYDGLGHRIRVEGVSPSTWTLSIFAGLDTVYEQDDAGAITKYVFANGVRIAKVSPSGDIQYYLGDHLGSTLQVRDVNRNLVFSAEYEPFGKPYITSGSEVYRYTGERHDDPTALVYLRARQYDPELGRFVSPDPLLGETFVPQTLNRYAYVANNPVVFSDPSGAFINLLAAAIGFIVGATIGYLGCVWATGGGWTNRECGAAGLAGGAAGALAGLTFGASLALAGTAGLGTAAAGGGFAFTGVSGLAAFAFAGATSGAVYGAAEYLVSGGLTIAAGGSWEFSTEEFFDSAGMGIVGGALGGAAGFVLGSLGSRLANGGLRSFGAHWTAGTQAHAAPHLQQLGGRVSVGRWFRGALNVARSPLSQVTGNPGGGFRAYGTIGGYPVRVPVRGGVIVTSFVDSGGIPWYFWRDALGIGGAIAGAGSRR